MPEFCKSYFPGHKTHWIPATRVYTETRRIPITIKRIKGTEFEITRQNQETKTLHHHDPVRLNRFIAKHPNAFNEIDGTAFITCKLSGSTAWFNMSPEPLQPCPYQSRSEMSETYLSSNIIVGYNNGTTWLLSDERPADLKTEDIPQETTFVITACDPKSDPATLQENHVNTLALEQDLKNNNLEYHIGWGSSEDGLHAELSFCVPVAEPEAVDATRQLLTELAIDYEQNAIFEITGTRVTLVPCLDAQATGTTIKYATLVAQPQSHFRQLLNSLRWVAEVDPNDLKQLNNIIEEAKKNA